MDALIFHANDQLPDLELRVGDIEYDCWVDLSATATEVYWKFREKSTTSILASGKCSKLYSGTTGYCLLSWENTDLDDLDAGSYELEITTCFEVSTGTLTGATVASPVVITDVAHGLTTGDEVYISGVVGMTELNDEIYTVTVIDADSFSLDSVDGSAYTAYTSGGTWEKLTGRQTSNKYFFEGQEDTNWDSKSLPIKMRADF